jgi:hypothetical protein
LPEGRGPSHVSLGDAFLVEARLRPKDEATREAIAELLGFNRERVSSGRSTTVGPWKPNEPAPASQMQAPAAPARASVPAELPPRIPPPVLAGAKTSSDYIGRITFERPGWAHVNQPFGPANGADCSLPPPPLFSASHVRGILSAMFATFHDGPEIDVDRAATRLGEGRRLDRIPYLPIATLRRGAQVLIDRAETLNPLRDDIGQLLADLERLFGRGHLEVLYFAHCPSARESRRRGVSTTPSSRPFSWRSPGRGVPVLIVSDFTLSPVTREEVDYASADEWEEFIGDVRAASCHPVGLVPYAPGRWPPALTAMLTFVHWSERTTPRQVMRALRETRRTAEVD